MAQKLMTIPIFEASIMACTKALLPRGIDVYKMLMSDDPDLYKNNTLNCMLAITAIQVKHRLSTRIID